MTLTRFFTNLYYFGLDTCELIAVNYRVVIQVNRITSTPDLVCITLALAQLVLIPEVWLPVSER